MIETDCTFAGIECGGAWLVECSDGRMRGVLYAAPKTSEVQDWHGVLRIPARFGNVWTSNMGDRRQSVYFTYEGRPFRGIWMMGSDIVRCTELWSPQARLKALYEAIQALLTARASSTIGKLTTGPHGAYNDPQDREATQ